MNCNTYRFFKVISNKTRWQIINTLYNSDKCVTEICEDTNEEQSKISHNLKILAECNIVFNKRDGKNKIYSLNKETIRPILNILEKHMTTYCSDCPYKLIIKK
jgi:ArsR family transcriptional regulator